MDAVTVSRTFELPPQAVRDAMDDLEPFMRAAGFDEVSVEGDRVRVENGVGFATIELLLEIVEDPDADLAYEQREGIFEEMTTTYTVESVSEGCELTAATAFALDVAIVGDVLDATVIKRQRRAELSAQFDWIAETRGDAA